MKKYFSRIFIALISLATFTGCESEATTTYDAVNGASLAAFAKTTGALPVFEVGTSVSTIKVNVSTVSDMDREMIVELDTEASTATSNQYSVEWTATATLNQYSVVVPAGKHYGEIKVTGYFPELDSNTYKLVFNLISVEGSTLETDPAYNTFELAIFKSCPIDGTLIDNSTYTGESYANDAFVTGFQPVMTKISENKYQFDTLWGSSFVAALTANSGYEGQYVYSGTITINDDLTLTIVGTEGGLPGGTGLYDPCTNTFTYVLQQTLFTNPFPVDVVLRPN